jgi:hypothetical protein
MLLAIDAFYFISQNTASQLGIYYPPKVYAERHSLSKGITLQ